MRRPEGIFKKGQHNKGVSQGPKVWALNVNVNSSVETRNENQQARKTPRPSLARGPGAFFLYSFCILIFILSALWRRFISGRAAA
jgi:hypothetical protein